MNESLEALFYTDFSGQNVDYQDNGKTSSQLVT